MGEDRSELKTEELVQTVTSRLRLEVLQLCRCGRVPIRCHLALWLGSNPVAW